MRLVLNLPLSSNQGEQAPGRRPLGAQARDPIDHFHPFLPCFLEEDVTPLLKHLRQPGPSAVAHQGLTRREMAVLDTPMAEVNGLHCVLMIAAGRQRNDQCNSGRNCGWCSLTSMT
jgi:hypothetical protein